MHVDGFRFDLASIMTRSSSLWDSVNVYGDPLEGDLIATGTPLNNPPLIDMMSNDPVLHGVKLIAEAWDAGGLYQVGRFPHWGVWSEWNGKYRDIVRQFIKGTDGLSGAFAECLCGSPNLYQEGGGKPWNSVNFICAHDGFTLADLVTYNNKHNLANGEDNNDGESHNYSWNCGQGVPMIHMGDEYGHTKGGNNNTYCHDNYIDSVKGEIYVAFNTSHLPVTITLPERPGYRWEPLVDTSKPAPFDFLSNEVPERELAIKQYAHFLDANLYPMLSYSSIVLLLSPDENA
ncbi:hypothetical protein GOBAR_AA19751 [Gossypium barbadense]|uniref:Isoamylase 1-3-like C-terminal domain-containing protein n=1 Tax=Gossypium barbadense TaxID=3634 RepID=A0A2P5XC75_GOSBA|nr:hypothetical protein GOBAR_AA19751 [Gossypium barbadense]